MAALGSALGSFLGGLPTGGVLVVTSAAQQSLNSVDVVYDQEPNHLDPSAPNDGLNLENYVTIATTPGATVPILQTAQFVAPTTIRLFFDATLTNDAVYSLTVACVETPGDALVSSIPLLFSTVAAARVVPVTEIGERRTDIANDPLTGHPRYDETGDLANDSGSTYRRKRLTRRATTALGSFFHLPGYGFRQRLKSLARPSERRDLALRIRAQVLEEPDIRAAEVDVGTLDGQPGIVVVTIRHTDVNDVLLPEMRIPIDTRGSA